MPAARARLGIDRLGLMRDLLPASGTHAGSSGSGWGGAAPVRCAPARSAHRVPESRRFCGTREPGLRMTRRQSKETASTTRPSHLVALSPDHPAKLARTCLLTAIPRSILGASL